MASRLVVILVLECSAGDVADDGESDGDDGATIGSVLDLMVPAERPALNWIVVGQTMNIRVVALVARCNRKVGFQDSEPDVVQMLPASFSMSNRSMVVLRVVFESMDLQYSNLRRIPFDSNHHSPLPVPVHLQYHHYLHHQNPAHQMYHQCFVDSIVDASYSWNVFVQHVFGNKVSQIMLPEYKQLRLKLMPTNTRRKVHVFLFQYK